MCALIDRELKKASPAQCVHLLYGISAICHASAKKHGAKDKYGESVCLGSSTSAVPRFSYILRSLQAGSLFHVLCRLRQIPVALRSLNMLLKHMIPEIRRIASGCWLHVNS